MNLNETLLTAVFLSMCVGSYCSCPKKPKDCSTDLIKFYLFNKNQMGGMELRTDGDKGSNDASIFTNEQIKLIFHGFTGSSRDPKMTELREAYLRGRKYADINVIFVDYEKLAQDGCYWTLVQSLNILGKCTAELIKNKIINNNVNIDRLHLIGFSFGAHAAAVTSEQIRSVGVFTRITGLDPGLPFFTFPFPGSWHKLNRSHAKFVDVIHTNSGMRGVYSSNAHLDIYGNYGMQQTGCNWTDMLCSHTRALDYYIESVNSDVPQDGSNASQTSSAPIPPGPPIPLQFYAVKCGRFSIFFGRCKFEPSAKTKEILVGEPCVPPEKKDEGSYYFPTRPTSPYAVGRPLPKPAAKQTNKSANT